MPVDIVDLTDLQKRGILKKKESVVAASSTTAETSSTFGFLDNLASAGSSNSETSYFDATPAPSTSLSVQDFKVKLEDFEYKLDRLVERLEKLEEKIQDSKGGSNFMES